KDDKMAAQILSSPGGAPQNLLFNGRIQEQPAFLIDWPLPTQAEFDSAPGGTFDFFQALAKIFGSGAGVPSSCFVPTISALAMTELDPYLQKDLFMNIAKVRPKSALDSYQYSSKNEPHSFVEPALNDWFCQQISGPRPAN